jgi:periplasmic protein CpxP/Spy
MFGPHAIAFFTHYLDLTDAQQAQVKDILAKEKPTLRPLLEQLAQSHHQLRQYEESGNFNEAQVRLIASQQAQTISELLVQKARIESELVQVLTPEQKTKLSQFIDKREQRFHQRLKPQAEPDQRVE